MGKEDEFHDSINAAFESTTVTLICGFLSAMMAHVGAPVPCQHSLVKTVPRTDVACPNACDPSDLFLFHHFTSAVLERLSKSERPNLLAVVITRGKFLSVPEYVINYIFI